MIIKRHLLESDRLLYEGCAMSFAGRKKFMPFVELKNDVAFRKVFGNKNRKIVVISFLNAILKLENERCIVDIEFLDPHQPPIIDSLKASILDVRAKDNRGKTYIIEMQVSKIKDLPQRVLYYVSKEYVSQVPAGSPYAELNPIIFIGIFDFDLTKGTDYLSHHTVQNVDTGERVIEGMDFYFIELTKFSKPIETLTNTMDEWIALFKCSGSLEQIPPNISDTGILAAFEDLKRHGWTDDELDAYIRNSHAVWEIERQIRDAKEDGLEQGHIVGFEHGKKEGWEEGRNQGFREARDRIIEKFKQSGMTESEIEHWLRDIP